MALGAAAQAAQLRDDALAMFATVPPAIPAMMDPPVTPEETDLGMAQAKGPVRAGVEMASTPVEAALIGDGTALPDAQKGPRALDN